MSFSYHNDIGSSKSESQRRLVIPGRVEDVNPESRDSGSGANAPSRNDKVQKNARRQNNSDTRDHACLLYWR
jgi:hypothetical protein